MDIEEAKKELLEIKKDNESKAMIINNNSSNMQIRWSNKDLKEMAEISNRCAREIRAIETVLSELDRLKKYEDLEWQEFNELAVASLELEKKDRIINLMAELIYNNLNSFHYYEVGIDHKNKDDLIEHFTNKVEREGK